MDDTLKKDIKDRETFSNGRKQKLKDLVNFEKNGCPKNFHGRTGTIGRGLLGNWGPNQAADPIVTRYDMDTGKLQVVLIKRKDNNQWGLPGGMVDKDDPNTSTTAKREFLEEAMKEDNEKTREDNEVYISKLFKEGRQIYQGYVDDPRNTDNAWMETTAYHFHLNPDDGKNINLPLNGGDDATHATWVNIDDIKEGTYMDIKLYASHNNMINQAIIDMPVTKSKDLLKAKAMSHQATKPQS
jgi:ADP-ribose pyrophosphatase